MTATDDRTLIFPPFERHFISTEFTFDVRERRLLRGTEAVRLSPKAYDVLVALVRQRGRLVTKEELLKCLWPKSFVEEGSLNVYVSALRKARGRGRQPAGIYRNGGTVLFLSEWDWTAVERSLRRALEINPDHTEALLQYGALQEALGRLADGLRCKQQALARDPRSPGVLVQIAISY